jgi:pilus assembly protein Flp/PilA
MRGWGEESGATAVEYAIMVALIAMVIVGSVAFLGGMLRDSYGCTAEHVEHLLDDPGPRDC